MEKTLGGARDSSFYPLDSFHDILAWVHIILHCYYKNMIYYKSTDDL
jgi:hypothetical protein